MDLLLEVKAYLNITYDDSDADLKLQGIIDRGISTINDYAGASLDYEEEGLHKQLLFDYCRYARSHAVEMFETNFRHDLIALREMEEVRQYANQIEPGISDVQ